MANPTNSFSTADLLAGAEPFTPAPTAFDQVSTLIKNKEAFFANPNAVFTQAERILEEDMRAKDSQMRVRSLAVFDDAVAQLGSLDPKMSRSLDKMRTKIAAGNDLPPVGDSGRTCCVIS